MTVTMAHVMFPCLVAMVAAAPVAERTSNQEQVVSLSGDGNVLDRAKRAKEEVVFGNQQNGAKVPASAAKKSSLEFPYPPLVPDLLSAQPEGPSYQSFPQVNDKMEQAEEPIYRSFPQVEVKGDPAEEPIYRSFPQVQDKADQAGYVYASKQMPLPQEVLDETAAELQAASAPGNGGPKKEGEAEEQKEIPEQQNPAEPVVNTEGDGQLVANTAMGPEQPQQVPEVKEFEEVEQAPETTDVPPEAQTPSPPAAVVGPEVQAPPKSRLPEDSRRADAEEALHAKNQQVDQDDIEELLQDLQEPKDLSQAGTEDNGEEDKDAEEEAKEEEEEEEEGSAEAELMEMQKAQLMQDAEAAEKTADPEDYRKQLLKYILPNGDEYGRAPVGYFGYPYPTSYYVQRRRRSLARGRLPHIHRRRRSGKQLARAKRTKRDLLDDELYYNPDAQYALQRAEEEEEEEKQAEMEELISYLVALYPAVYENQPPPRGSPYPWYLWYGSNYPEEAYPEYPEWEEEPDYADVPFANWEPPSQPAPAWEPAFYPEEVEEQNYYPPAPLKRQMPDLLPGQRLKRYFYPYAQEPYAHWGAFIPSQEKRDYDDAYRRLKDLAMVLSDARQPSPYFDAFGDYRKK